MTQWQNNGVLTTYGYTSGRPHAVSSTSGGVNATFGYDPQGNMNNRTQNGVSYVQGFDKENRLTSVTTNGQTTHFKYDANGQRTMTLAPSGLYTFYPFPNVEEEVNLNNQDYTLKYTYSSAGVAAAVRTKAKQGATTTNTLHYLYSDHLGSTSTVTNSSGGQVQQTRFLPFGGYWGTPTQTVTDRGYTGHLHNDEVGLIYMNARFYVPSIGRFASADTIVPNPTNPQAFNRYSYVKNNPLNRVDPTGHVDCGMLGDEGDKSACSENKKSTPQPKPKNTVRHITKFSNTSYKAVLEENLKKYTNSGEFYPTLTFLHSAKPDSVYELSPIQILAILAYLEHHRLHPAHSQYNMFEDANAQREWLANHFVGDVIGIMQTALHRTNGDLNKLADVAMARFIKDGEWVYQYTFGQYWYEYPDYWANINDPIFQDFVAIAGAVLSGDVADMIGGAKFFGHYDTSFVNNGTSYPRDRAFFGYMTGVHPIAVPAPTTVSCSTGC